MRTAALACALWAAAGGLAWLHVAHGPATQRVHIRWSPSVTPGERAAAERELSLRDGRPREGATWTYLVTERSEADVSRLLAHPAVDDTHFIDRSRRRVEVDVPALPGWLRDPLEEEQLPWVAGLAAAAAAVLTWRARGTMAHGGRQIARAVRRWTASAAAHPWLCDPTRRAVPAASGLLALAVLLATPQYQIYDTNFYTLWEATNVTAGDHPYRDFFEWGAPLAVAFSALGQWLSGGRLGAEFLVSWGGMIAGIVGAAMLALRWSGSPAATLAVGIVTTPIVLHTPTFQYPKLLIYPWAVWLGWAYLEAPSVRRGAALGALTGAAFLFRHDHGVYVGVLAVLVFAAARWLHPASRRWRTMAREALVYTAVAAVLILPWAALVESGEGLVRYVRLRADLYRMWSARGLAYGAVGNPFRVLWPGPDGWHPPASPEAVAALRDLVLLIPAATGVLALRRLRRMPADDASRGGVVALLVASIFVALVDASIVVEPSYLVGTAPLTGALAAVLLAAALEPSRSAHGAAAVRWFRRFAAAAAFTTAAVAVGAWHAEAGPGATFVRAWRQMLAVRTIDGALPADAARAVTPEAWAEGVDDPLMLVLRYVHDCTGAGDRVLVTGSTPYQVGYYVQRPVAGGHVFWHHGWRSGAEDDRQLAALLDRQDVPFAVSTHEPVLDDLRRYARVYERVSTRYVEVAGTGGRVLVERGRLPTGRFGALGWPCFR